MWPHERQEPWLASHRLLLEHEVALMWHHFPAKSRWSQLVKSAPPNLRIQHSSLGPTTSINLEYKSEVTRSIKGYLTDLKFLEPIS
jgi:hypothetical protein